MSLLVKFYNLCLFYTNGTLELGINFISSSCYEVTEHLDSICVKSEAVILLAEN